MKKKEPIQFVVCLDNKGYPASLEMGKIYRSIPDEEAEAEGLVRVIDESGEDYLFAGAQFAVVEFPETIRRKLLALQKAG